MAPLLLSAFLLAGVGQTAGPETEALDARLRAIMEAPGLTVRELRITPRSVTIGIELPERTPLDALPVDLENRVEIAAGAVSALLPSARAIHLLVAHPGERLRPPPVHAPLTEKAKVIQTVRTDPSRFPFGQSLIGKTVALSPGHGYEYYDALGGYSTQRGNVRWTGCGDCRGITEDFETHEIVVRYLVPLLEGAGARVVLVRERAYSDDLVVVDDGDPGYRESNGAFAAGVSEGGNQDDYRTAFDPGSTAEWTLTAQQPGKQLLSLWFVAGTNRLTDAELEVDVPGSQHRYSVDLTGWGRRWTPIELFDLSPGDVVSARLSAPLAGAGDRALIADAVRLGAGKHTTNHPWWQMSAQDFAAYQNAPPAVQAYNDVTIRPRYSEFYGADIYVAVHSNASGIADSTAAGTATYRYNCGLYADHSNDPPPADCDDPIGSDSLQALVHQSLIDALRTDWDPAWVNRGTLVANFGEVRELDGIPGILIETAFHDNVRLAAGSALRVTDNQSLHDPRWRRTAAFGIYRGISEYLVGQGPLVAPPPEALSLRHLDRTSVALAFEPVPGASGYRVYVAQGNRTFDQGRLTTTSTIVLDDLLEDTAIAVKVASLDAAGEGRSSAVVVARTSGRPAQALIVDAFQREDAWVQEYDNQHDTALAYGLAAGGTAYAFDGANERALASGLIDLAGYDAIILALGRESTEHGVLTPDLRDRIAAFAQAGGAVFASGSEIAYALDLRGDDPSRAFLEDVFGAGFGADDAGAAAIGGAPGAWLEPITSALVSVSSAGMLEARSSDVLAASSGSVELLYAGGAGAAAVRRDHSLLMGVALDSVADLPTRTAILGGWLENAVVLAPEDLEPPPDAGVPPDGGAPGPDASDEVDGGTKTLPDAAFVPDASDALDAASPADGSLDISNPVAGGCGCSAAPEPRVTGPLPLVGLLLGLIAARLGSRRRRRAAM